MKSYDELKAENETIQQKWIEARLDDRANKLIEVKRMCVEFGFTAEDLKGSLAEGHNFKRLIKNIIPKSVKLRIQKRVIKDEANELIYVHIGKCGGASLAYAINESHIIKENFSKVHTVHIKKPPILKNAKYVIVIRNPIKRAISAFNWRFHLVVEKEIQRQRFKGEWEVLNTYKTLNNLAEALYVDDDLDVNVSNDFRKIHHLNENIAFYLSDLILNINAEQVFCVLSTETLNKDIAHNLAVTETKIVHEHGKFVNDHKKKLSELAYKNLKKYLSDDYSCIKNLLELNNTTACDLNILLDQ